MKVCHLIFAGPTLVNTLSEIKNYIRSKGAIKYAEQHILNKLPINSISINPLQTPEKQKELEQLSAKFRNEGNEEFKKANYMFAYQYYTRSVACALSGPVCALAYANRCAIYINFIV